VKGDRLVLIILIDALGHRIVAESSFLDGFVPPGKPIRTIFGYSSAAIPSLLTGALPQEHGHFSMYLRDPENSPLRQDKWMIRLFGEWLKRPWFLKKRLMPRIKRRGITGYFSLYEIPSALLPEWDLCQKRSLFKPNAIPGYPSVVDTLAERRIPHKIWDWSVPEDRALRELKQEVALGQTPYLFYYTPAMDSLMHMHGTRTEVVQKALAEWEETIKKLVSEGEKHFREVRLFVFGDHGMADVTGSTDLWSRLPAIGPPRKRGTLYFLDSTMARFWFDSDAERRRTEEILSRETCGRCLSAGEERALGAHFPDARYGELTFLLDAGKLIVPSFMGWETIAGMHGYHPDDVDSYTTLLTNTDVEHPADIRGFSELLKREALALC
jgi:hypothetical protein